MQLDIPPPLDGPVSDDSLAFDFDIFILVFILAFTLINVPRTLTYIANNGSRAFQGYLLRSATRSRTRTSAMAEKSTEKSMPESSIPVLESAVLVKQAWHFPMYCSLRHPIANLMQYHVIGDYIVLQVVLMAGYTAAVFYIAFWQSNLFTTPIRFGWVIACQIPFVYAFATKNNVIGLAVGVGYEKLNYLHRHVGRLIVIGANVHAIGFLYSFSLGGYMGEALAQPYIRWGIVTLVCFDILFLFSLQWVRTNSYNLFFWTHVVGLIVVPVAACFHQQACIPFVIAGSAVYILDHVIRIIKTRYAIATLRTIPELGLTRVGIPSIGTGWRPGQHVRLRVLSGLGLLGMTEVHPFTIASATNTEEGLVLLCKKTGNWTTKLYEAARSTAIPSEEGVLVERSVKVIVEGPYGGIGDTTVSNYSGAMFIVGGSGVTFALSAVQDLVLRKNRTKVIDIVWSITDPAALESFIPLFSELLSASRSSLRILVFYTRTTARPFKGLSLPPCITLSPGRPKTAKLLDEFIACVTTNGGEHGAFVAVCGPRTLAKAAAHAVRTCNVKSKKAIGGIQFHNEVFGW